MNADPVARVYRVLEYATFGPMLWRARTHYISHLKDKRRILIAGEGDGRFLASLLQLNPQAQIDIYDTSAKMIELAKSRTTAHHHRLAFHHADITSAPLPAQTYDAIVANFFLDCFSTTQLQHLILKLKPVAIPNATWLIAEFAIPKNGLRRQAAQIFIAFLYKCFALTTGLKATSLPDYQRTLHNAGLVKFHRRDHLAGLLTSQLWQ